MTDTSSERILVLGLGNDILTDDAVGLLVVREVQERFAHEPDIVVRETTDAGLALLDHVVGFRSLVMVDSIQTGEAPPGTVHSFTFERYREHRLTTPHSLGVADTFALGRRLGLAMPEEIHIFAIEAADLLTLGTGLTPPVAAALPHVVNVVAEHVHRLALTHVVEHYF